MTHVYKAKRYAILKVNGIPLTFQENTVLHCQKAHGIFKH